MHLLGQSVLGWLIVVLLAALVVVKRVASGSLLERPSGGPLAVLVNVFNLLFLLLLNPVAAILLIAGRMEALDPTHVALGPPGLVTVLELAGLAIYAMGFLLMAWALVVLGRSYQLGGASPRASDRLVASGPYAVVRHPMYSAALAIAFGLASVVQSWGVAVAFGIYLVLILLLIPREEAGLRQAYGERYEVYRRRTKKLVAFAY